MVALSEPTAPEITIMSSAGSELKVTPDLGASKQRRRRRYGL